MLILSCMKEVQAGVKERSSFFAESSILIDGDNRVA